MLKTQYTKFFCIHSNVLVCCHFILLYFLNNSNCFFARDYLNLAYSNNKTEEKGKDCFFHCGDNNLHGDGQQRSRHICIWHSRNSQHTISNSVIPSWWYHIQVIDTHSVFLCFLLLCPSTLISIIRADCCCSQASRFAYFLISLQKGALIEPADYNRRQRVRFYRYYPAGGGVVVSISPRSEDKDDMLGHFEGRLLNTESLW